MTATTSASPPLSPGAPDPRAGTVEINHGPIRGPRKGLAYWVGLAWLKLNGWDIVGGVPPVKHAVIIASPHTSNWDLPFSLAIGWVLNVRIHWMGKDSLFKPPLGWLMRALNGVPVDRSRRNQLVSDSAARIRASESMYLMVPPEGTRGVASRWKTGFYWIAHEAQVPIILGYLDFGRKRGGLGALLWPSGDIKKDFEHLKVYYADIKGYDPSLQSPVTLGDESGS